MEYLSWDSWLGQVHPCVPRPWWREFMSNQRHALLTTSNRAREGNVEEDVW